MLADKPTSFKPLFRHSMEMNVIKKGVLEVYGLKYIEGNSQPEASKKAEKSERIEPRRRNCRSGESICFFCRGKSVNQKCFFSGQTIGPQAASR